MPNMAHYQALSYSAFPPHRHVSAAKPISADTALAHIQSYLERAQDAAYLQPDVIFRDNGPEVSRHASEGGIVLQLLRRVEKGLKGERIVVDLPPAGLSSGGTGEDDDDDLPPGDDSGFGQSYAQQKKHTGLGDDGQAAIESSSFIGKSYNEQMIEEGEDGITDGDIAARSNFVRDLTGATNSKKRRLSQVGDSSKLNKEERKRAKKERQLEERRRQQEEKERLNQSKKLGKDVDGDIDMDEIATTGVVDNEIGAVDKLAQVAPAVQNGKPSKNDTSKSAEDIKAENKAKRKAKKEAKRKAQEELNGGTTGHDNDSQDEVIERPEERGKVEVVNKLGQEAQAPASQLPERKKKKKDRQRKQSL